MCRIKCSDFQGIEEMEKMKDRKINTPESKGFRKARQEKTTEEMKTQRMDLHFSFLCVLD